MIVIRNKKHNFNIDYVSKLTEKQFKDHCLTLDIFLQLPEKARNLKIKEVYGNIQANATEGSQSRKDVSNRDIHDGNAKSIGRDSGAESSANDGGEGLDRGKDNPEVRKQKLSKQDSK